MWAWDKTFFDIFIVKSIVLKMVSDISTHSVLSSTNTSDSIGKWFALVIVLENDLHFALVIVLENDLHFALVIVLENDFHSALL